MGRGFRRMSRNFLFKGNPSASQSSMSFFYEALASHTLSLSFSLPLSSFTSILSFLTIHYSPTLSTSPTVPQASLSPTVPSLSRHTTTTPPVFPLNNCNTSSPTLAPPTLQEGQRLLVLPKLHGSFETSKKRKKKNRFCDYYICILLGRSCPVAYISTYIHTYIYTYTRMFSERLVLCEASRAKVKMKKKKSGVVESRCLSFLMFTTGDSCQCCQGCG